MRETDCHRSPVSSATLRCSVDMLVLLQCRVQPCSRLYPIARDCTRSDAERKCRFFLGEPGEKPALYYMRSARIELAESDKRLVQCQQLFRALRDSNLRSAA